MDTVIFYYTDKHFNELGVFKNATIDFEIGKYNVATNDFQLALAINEWDRNFDKGSIFYALNTEFGGLISSKKVDTSKNTITFFGKTFRGLLEKEYIQPQVNQAYYIAFGEANEVIANLISDRFGNLYTIDNYKLSDIEVNYQIRDLNLLEALEKMLFYASIKSRIDILYFDGHVHLQAIPVVDLSELIQFDKSYGIAMIAQTQKASYNSVIALGKGELTERMRVNLYLQKDGTWSTAENYSYYGLNKITYKYDNGNEDNESTLIDSAIDAVTKANGTDSLQVTFKKDDVELFNIVAAKEDITNISLKEAVTKKILKVTIKNTVSNCKFEYKVGD